MEKIFLINALSDQPYDDFSFVICAFKTEDEAKEYVKKYKRVKKDYEKHLKSFDYSNIEEIEERDHEGKEITKEESAILERYYRKEHVRTEGYILSITEIELR